MKLLSQYYSLLRKDKLFLVWNASIISFLWCGFFLHFTNPVSVICWAYTLFCNFGCFVAFLKNIKKELDRRIDESKQEKQLLDFWFKECGRLYTEAVETQQEYQKAEKEFRLDDSAELLKKYEGVAKQYENSTKRYILEIKRLGEKHGIKVDVKKINNSSYQE